MMKTCNYCGYGNPDNVGACEKCGAPQRDAFARGPAAPRAAIATVGPIKIGCDVSHWKGVIDWDRVNQSRINNGYPQFVIAKCTEGTNYFDDTYLRNKSECARIKMPFGAYHFFRSNQDGVAQANFFYSKKGNGVSFLMGDHETDDGGNIIQSTYNFHSRLHELNDDISRIYTAFYFWRDHYGNIGWAKEHPLVVANYGVQQPAIPLPWTEYEIWQNTSHGRVDGISGDVDMDRTEKDVYAIFKNGDEVPAPPPIPDLVRVTAGALNIRATPGGAWVGVMPNGFIVHPTGVVKDANGRDWYYSGASGCFASWYTEEV